MEELTLQIGYQLIEQGGVKSVIIGERSRYILLDNYHGYFARLDAEQNGPAPE